MGLISKLLSFTRADRDAKLSDVKIDNGGGHNVTAEHFSSAGDDSFPLKTDYVLSSSVPKSGGQAAHGYIDPLNEPLAEEGDKRIYARNSADGLVIAELWLKNDGTATIKNASGSTTLTPEGAINSLNSNGYFNLESGGDFVVNGVTIDINGNITTPTDISCANASASVSLLSPSVQAGGKELTSHTHTITTGSSAGTTSPNN